MDILEQRAAWAQSYQSGWLAHHQQTGEFDWKQYKRPRNAESIAGAGIPLDSSRIVLISSAGGYLHKEQEPFDAPHPYGDYSIRSFSIYTPFEQIAFAHDHYDHSAVNADPQVLLPLRHLNQMEDENWLGDVAPQMISFMGYQPDVSRLLDETIPAIVAEAKSMGVGGALLVPS